jgi:sugar phosphate isomerase/epimerase
MRIGPYDIGVCSWSLRTKDAHELVKAMSQLGIRHVQLAIGPLLALEPADQMAELAMLRDAGISITAGMIGFSGEEYGTIASIKGTGGFVPDDLWEARKEITARAALLCKSIGLDKLSAHIGFVPPSSNAKYGVMLDRVCAIADLLAEASLDLLMETGQEAASELLQFLNDLRCRNVGINFDPANMILYGAGDPIEAVHTLGRHIRHVHIKDAIASDQPGMSWGREVPFGTGQVAVDDFFAALHATSYSGPLVIEREAGVERFEDVKFAMETIQRSIEGPASASLPGT